MSKERSLVPNFITSQTLIKYVKMGFIDWLEISTGQTKILFSQRDIRLTLLVAFITIRKKQARFTINLARKIIHEISNQRGHVNMSINVTIG